MFLDNFKPHTRRNEFFYSMIVFVNPYMDNAMGICEKNLTNTGDATKQKFKLIFEI